MITLRHFLVAGPLAVIVAHKFDFLEEQNKTTEHGCTVFAGFVNTSLRRKVGHRVLDSEIIPIIVNCFTKMPVGTKLLYLENWLITVSNL